MAMLRVLGAGALSATLMLATATFAQTTGQATGEGNVAPSTGPAAGGNPGVRGLPGNKNGPAEYSSRKASAGSTDTGVTTGPATGENVMPGTSPSAAGGAGVQGYPGNKSGPEATPPKSAKKDSSGSMNSESHQRGPE